MGRDRSSFAKQDYAERRLAMTFMVQLCLSEYRCNKLLNKGNTVSVTSNVTKGGSSMTFMCSISPSNAEITRDESKDVIF